MTMGEKVRVTTVQMPALLQGRSMAEKKKKNHAFIRQYLEEAGRAASDIVLFGEYANLWHRGTSERKKDYVPETLQAPIVGMVSSYAKRYGMNVIFPMLATMDDVPGNYCLIFDRQGSILGSYRKSHPTVPERELGMVPGDKLSVFTLDCMRIGIMTCMDIEYPEVAMALMLQGAELLAFPHVQGSWGDIEWEIRYRARAIDTGLFLVSSSYGYEEGEWMPGKMTGRSGLVGKDGTILAEMGHRIGTLTMDLDPRHKRITPFFFNQKLDRTPAVCASRRPELYGVLTDIGVRQAAWEQVESLIHPKNQSGRKTAFKPKKTKNR